ncbi:nitrous oxide reductase family maturation protein NosD [Thiohalobacter thiocyanaticus]|uniref:Nitrous oxide reductase family maturation protein NosD n=1 Tax=Thiohalobacter thiocyanaticus TaxID=585455 RepID=A0A426QMT7_9GAMM|nr:nitrous oxide reductase family maturation protein NosD [Thiohalobacter thiocyanaticus]
MQPLQQRVDAAAAGAVIEVPAGTYTGNLVISRALTLKGSGEVILDGNNSGDVVRVRAADVTIAGLVIRNSGKNLTDMNAGIFAEKAAENLRVIGSRFENNAFGLWLDGCRAPEVIDNRIQGAPQLRSQDNGNGIHLFAVHDGLVRGNHISGTRDGIYIDTSQHNRLEDNLMEDLRYGIHYMYSYNNEVIDNRTRNTRTGYALMQSKNLEVRGNASDGDLNYGMLLNNIVGSHISGNRIRGTRTGRAFVTGGDDVAGADGKALFIYNSQYNEISGNLLEDADIGIHLTAGSEDNAIHGNAFIRNRVQVKYVATREQEWSDEGRGNYWSDYLGWDMNADGVGDRPYEPNDAVDKLLWRYPMARILMSSPAIETLRWVQRQFPVFKPQGVRDSHPLMQMPVSGLGGTMATDEHG